MATTQYQVLARYYNTHTNNPITNDGENAYNKTFGFYTEDASSTITEIIMEGNNPQNVKNDMLFAYAGTKKVFPTDGSVEYAAEKARMEEEVAELTLQNTELNNAISSSTTKITDATRQLDVTISGTVAALEQQYHNEYEGYKTDLEAYKALRESLYNPTGGIRPLSEWIDGTGVIEPGYYYSHRDGSDYCWAARIYVHAPAYTGYGTLNTGITYGYISAASSSTVTNVELDAFSNTANGASLRSAIISRLNSIINAIDAKMTTAFNLYDVYRLKKEEYQNIKNVETVNKAQYQQIIAQNTVTIADNNAALATRGEAKFDAQHKWPYMIVDVYERVWFSPWFSVHVCGSLNSALEKAKVIVSAIGIDNVKIIKLVSIDQFIKIR